MENLCVLDEGGKFAQNFHEIYPTKLELKVEHNGSHTALLDLDISIDKREFIYKMFDKEDALKSDIVRMSAITINLPSSILYSSCSSCNLPELLGSIIA